MLTLHTWKTPNGLKPIILLEELGVPYKIDAVDIGKDQQFDPKFLKVSPNNKIPAITDGELTLFESGAILVYLAEKHHKFLPRGEGRYKALEWTFWQAGGLGPMLGQLGYFAVRSKEKVPHAIERFTDESVRLLKVLDKQLGEHEHMAGNEYTIADIMTWPWANAALTFLKEPLAAKTADLKNFNRWVNQIKERGAVKKAQEVLEKIG